MAIRVTFSLRAGLSSSASAIGLAADDDGALLDAAMRLVEVDEAVAGAPLKPHFDAYRGWLLLTASR